MADLVPDPEDKLTQRDYRPMNKVHKLIRELKKQASPMYAGSTFLRPEERFIDDEDQDVQGYIEAAGEV